MLDVLEALDCADDGLSVTQIESVVNMPFSRIESTLKLLSDETPSPIRKEGRSGIDRRCSYIFNVGKVQQLTTICGGPSRNGCRSYMRTTDCLMQFLAARARRSVRRAVRSSCANCAGGPIVPPEYPPELASEAANLPASHRPADRAAPKVAWGRAAGHAAGVVS